jgi:hypothetical protein
MLLTAFKRNCFNLEHNILCKLYDMLRPISAIFKQYDDLSKL